MNDNFLENIVFPIITNIVSPIILFVLASIIMKSNKVSKFISKIYLSVKNGLELNTEEIVDANEASDKNISESDEIHLVEEKNSNYTDSQILKKLSKDYGADSETGWKVRTFYTLAKKQLFEHEIVNFKVKGDKFNLYIKTEDLIKYFKLNEDSEEVSDGAGKIRVYIFQKKNDDGTEENYLIRFGRKALDEPILLKNN